MKTLDIFQYDSYQKYLQDYLRPSLKKGALGELASFLGCHPSRLTRFIKGNQQPTSEQSYLITKHFNLDARESQYFLALVELARATSDTYKKFLKEKLSALREGRAQPPATMNAPERPMNQSEENLFHSSYLYMAIWMASAITHENSLEEIAGRLEIPVNLVEQYGLSLCQMGLCEIEFGRIKPLARLLSFTDQYGQLTRFLSNWRALAIQRVSTPSPHDYFYSEPMGIGRTSAEEIRKILKTAVSNSKRILAGEASEELFCLNVDFFKIDRNKKA